jgi:hypothetical protein
VLEHESQYVCSACLARTASYNQDRQSVVKNYFSKALLPLLGGGAFLGAWFIFYLIGEWLLKMKAA